MALLAGAAKVNITPPLGGPMAGYAARDRGSEAIDDPLHAAALVLEADGSAVALITTDLIGVSAELTAAVRRGVAEATGIPAGHVMLCASHTHFGPEVRARSRGDGTPPDERDTAYVTVLQHQLVGAVRLAHAARRPARIGAGRGWIDGISYNRRTLLPDGSCEMNLRLPTRSDNVTFGPSDPVVNILRVTEEAGPPLAALVNFACHPVSSTDRMYAISADYPGYTQRLVEAEEGGLCLFALGCAGDLVPIQRQGRSKRQLGLSLGGEVLKTLQWLPVAAAAPLAARQQWVEMPYKEEKRVEDRSALRVELQALRLGDTLLVGLPGEILIELGMAIRERAGRAAPHLFLISLANESIGYVCHRRSYEEGGYEPTSSRFAPGAGELLVDGAVALIESIRE
jgi:Neutral/alkaline non-lysosomal ceramidase, N-terminal